jgi:hypothetical protein
MEKKECKINRNMKTLYIDRRSISLLDKRKEERVQDGRHKF